MLEIRKYLRKPFVVQAVQVTEANMEDVAMWCQGEIITAEGEQYIKVKVERILNERQSRAFLTDWVLFAGGGYKVYTDKAFAKSFDEDEVDTPIPAEATA